MLLAKIAVLALALLVSGTCPVLANDSSAEVATGGLLFTKSESVKMLSEDLFISTRDIRVRYRFVNKSDRDVVTTVAFPMPDIVPYNAEEDNNFVLPETNDPQNILGFTTTVNGRSVTARVEQKAIVAGVDRTDVLRRLGVSPSLVVRDDDRILNRPRSNWDEIIRLGLAKYDDDNHYLIPLWTLKTTYYWQQVFPAHQELVIDHRYLPSVGEVVPVDVEHLGFALRQVKYCVDKAFLDALPKSRLWETHTLEYILVTGANWSGPIKDFRLVVDKGSPDNLVSFCANGIRKIGPTQFEVRARDFVPTSNLSILILSPPDLSGLPDQSPTPPPAGKTKNPYDQFDAAALGSGAAHPKAYRVTGPVLEVTDTMIACQHGTDRWEIARDSNTKVMGDLKVGSNMTIEYTMTATKVEEKPSPSINPSGLPDQPQKPR
jgi:hypothetical protein